MRSYINLVRLLPKEQLNKLFLIIPLLGIAGVLEVASIASLIPLLGSVLDPDRVKDWNALVGLSMLSYKQTICYLVFLVIFLFIVKGFFGLFVYNLSYKFVADAKAQYQAILFKGYLEKDFIYHLNNNSGDYLRNLTTECNAIEARFIMPCLVLLAEVIPLSFLVVFLLYLNPYGFVLSASLFLIIGFLIATFNAKRLKTLAKLQISSDGSIVKNIQQTFSCIREVLIYDRTSYIEERFKTHCDVSAKSIAKGLTYNTVPKFVLEVVAVLCVFLIAFISYASGNAVQDILVELGVFLATMIKVLPSTNKIISHIQALAYSRPSIFNYLTALSNQKTEKYQDTTNIGSFESIEFKNVCFEYDGGHRILDNVNFEIKQGAIIGIVGETGSGKSTLINLLLGLVRPSSGEVLINGVPIVSAKNSYWRQIGYVPQEIYLVDENINSNITFYRKNLDDQVQKILKSASLESTIHTLDRGLMTNVGEGGSNLSGGQRQRIGFARALIGNPELLILDEATSALDRVTEQNLIKNLSSIKADKTIIMIAHRESSLSICDYILRVQNGNVSRESNHYKF
ncbi:ABC transporter ATP-binding protein [Vibrio tetraodonis]|uniref:ABC transporter ATP-binding protein n=1 Tax=Vibrio tetraodonis TaxID=2231647 RepID=UPI000E0A3407|nr:ABC transporter ATP-binding protein [Vibrio tetraodonis]